MESVILAMAAAPSWHGAGAAQWRKMREITPHSYLCRRVDPAKPLSLADPDVRTAGLLMKIVESILLSEGCILKNSPCRQCNLDKCHPQRVWHHLKMQRIRAGKTCRAVPAQHTPWPDPQCANPSMT